MPVRNSGLLFNFPDNRKFRVTVRKIPQDCAGFGFVYKAHPAAHIEICVVGCNAPYRQTDGPKDKQDVELCFAGALIRQAQLRAIQCFEFRIFVHQNTVV